MNKKNTTIGVTLILIGVAMYMRNFNIRTGTLITLLLGFGLLCAYYVKKEQPFMIFGGIFTALGLISVLEDIKLFRLDVTFETVLIALGAIFIFLYYRKQIRSFIFPGMILPAFGIHFLLLRAFNDRYAFPSIFLLLGLSFYAIYFAAYMGKASWPLVIATIFLIGGIAAYAFSFDIISWNMVYMNLDYIGPLLMISAGVLILLGRLKKRT